MFYWIRQLFCKHHFHKMERPVMMRRWVEDPNARTEVQSIENGHWETYGGVEVLCYCIKCGYSKTYTR